MDDELCQQPERAANWQPFVLAVKAENHQKL